LGIDFEQGSIPEELFGGYPRISPHFGIPQLPKKIRFCVR
jgi:hypothetical protein